MLETFLKVYSEELARAVKEHPEDYCWGPKSTVESVTATMAKAIEGGTYNKDGRAFRGTCKRLGIAHTYTAINAYVKGA